MIKNKSSVIELLNDLRSFSYSKEDTVVDVGFITDKDVNIRYYDEKCIVIKYHHYEDAVSALYKDRKYINKVLFQ
jgi:AAA15 family ATPase/GTPase